MAMQTSLFAIPQARLDALVANPDSVGDVDAEKTFGTYLQVTLSYFLTGSESGDHPLGEVLGGSDSVECARLENAYFFVVSAPRVKELSELLAKVDGSELSAKVMEAELEEIMDGELYEELEMASLFTPEEVAAEMVSDLERLKTFYRESADAGLALFMYTT